VVGGVHQVNNPAFGGRTLYATFSGARAARLVSIFRVAETTELPF
jgi:hypothetical protein